MKWYFTPSIGNYGGCVELDEDGYVRRLAFASLSEAGLAFVKWAPLEDGMCLDKGANAHSLILYEANENQISKLNSMWSNIIQPNGKPRLIQ